MTCEQAYLSSRKKKNKGKCTVCGKSADNIIEFYDPNRKLSHNVMYTTLFFCDACRDELYGLIRSDIFRMRLHLEDEVHPEGCE